MPDGFNKARNLITVSGIVSLIKNQKAPNLRTNPAVGKGKRKSAGVRKTSLLQLNPHTNTQVLSKTIFSHDVKRGLAEN